jgi:hypothetical protein
MAGLVPAIFVFRQALDMSCVVARAGYADPRAENPDRLSLM